MSTMTTGIVKWFDVGKDIGFIIQKQGPDVFVHSKNIINLTNSFQMLDKGQHVQFILSHGPKGLQAEKVTLI